MNVLRESLRAGEGPLVNECGARGGLKERGECGSRARKGRRTPEAEGREVRTTGRWSWAGNKKLSASIARGFVGNLSAFVVTALGPKLNERTVAPTRHLLLQAF